MDQPTTESGQSLLDQVEELARTNIELYTLQATDKVSTVVSSLLSRIIFGLLGFVFALLLCISLALWVGDRLGQPYLGFLVVAGGVSMVSLIVYLFRNAWIRKPVEHSIITKVLQLK